MPFDDRAARYLPGSPWPGSGEATTSRIGASIVLPSFMAVKVAASSPAPVSIYEEAVTGGSACSMARANSALGRTPMRRLTSLPCRKIASVGIL